MNQSSQENQFTSIENVMNIFKTDGISVLEKLNETQFNQLIKEANTQYHGYLSNEKRPILTDGEYDIAKEYLERKYPKSSVLTEVGADVSGKQKVLLPVNMPSMDKIKPDTSVLPQWCKTYKGPYILSCKLDGISGLYYTLNNQYKLFTRGNGTYGQDVSKLLTLLADIPTIPGIIVRGEFILTKQIFDEKYKTKFSNIRNMVAGLINRKQMVTAIKDIHFVAYEVIHPVLPPSEQMNFLQKNGFRTVQYDTQTKLSNEMLSNILIQWRDHYSYEIDGIIVANNGIYTRTESNPEHTFAFKMIISDQIAETYVTDVIWTASKDGYLKPRVRVNPIHIGGVKIEYATGFNAQFIEKNKIGIGAILQIIRSGDVIPYIQCVTTPAKHAKMPEVQYVWTDTRVDIMLANKEQDPVVLEKQITNFFTTLEVDGLGPGNVKRLIQCGYDTIPKIIHMTETEFQQVEGFQKILSKKIFENIRVKMNKSSLGKIMVACGCFGRGLGTKKINPILEAYPEMVTSTESLESKKQKLLNIPGIGEENANRFLKNIPKCIQFLHSCGLQTRLKISNLNKDRAANVIKHPLFEKTIIFTGFREKDLMRLLEETYHVSFVSSVTKKTNLVVVKSQQDSNTKITQAIKLNIPIMNIDQFKLKFDL